MNHWRKVFVLLFILSMVLTACGGDDDKKEEKLFKIGVLNHAESMNAVYDGFKAGMSDLGYTEGENLDYVYEIASIDELPTAAQRLIDADVDLILALATPASLAAQAATTETPVVFTPISYPVASGLVSSLQSPDANLTGIKAGGFVPKELEWLLAIIGDDADLIFAPHNPEDSASQVSYEELLAAADLLGVTIVSPEVTSPEEIIASLENIPPEVDGLLIIGDAMLSAQAAVFGAKGIELGLPTAGFASAQVQAGVLFSFGPEFYPTGYQAARLADQILKGVPPRDLPVETAEFIISINLVTAEASGIEISDEMLNQARNGTIVRPE